MAETETVLVNDSWPLRLLPHRAARPEWPTWETERLSYVHSRVKSGTVIWEVGAEEGDFPALYATWGAEVVMIEPNPFVWPQIKIHWEANTAKRPLASVVGLASSENVEATPDYPTGTRDGWPECAYGEIRPEHGFRHLAEHGAVSPQFRLDSLALPAPDLICMDIEGAELHALRGAEGVLASHHPEVVVSIHPSFLRDLYGQSSQEVHDFMADLGYRGHHLATDHEEHWVYARDS